jgi:hypothetical protein
VVSFGTGEMVNWDDCGAYEMWRLLTRIVDLYLGQIRVGPSGALFFIIICLVEDFP